MDPHPHSGDSDISLDSCEEGESVSYLRRLRGSAAAAAPAGATHSSAGRASGAAVAPALATSPEAKERRKSPRIRCSGSAEFRAEGNKFRMLGSVTDISLHGCYVEMNTTFPVGTRVELALTAMDIRTEAAGTVRAIYPGLGMGIAFTDIKPAELLQLQKLLAALPSRNFVVKAAPAQGANAESMRTALAGVDAKAFVDEIALFLQKTPALTRVEFYRIAKRVRRS